MSRRGGAPLLRTVGLVRTYGRGDLAVQALRGIDLEIDHGEYVAIMGASGGGKSSLMNVLGCLDRPTSGRYEIDGRDVATLDDDELATLRNRTIGFVFQSFNLLPRTSALENVELPLLYGDTPRAEQRPRAMEALARVGLAGREWSTPSQLSGGQQQRVAIARALVGRPSLLLADEPTGNLDSDSGRTVLDLLRRVNLERGATIVLVTHSAAAATWGDRTVELRDGRVLRESRPRGQRRELDV